jgi:predicted RNA-binding Zn ribbon-like protein
VARVTPETIKLWGGVLCLDFANSVDWSAEGEPIKDDVLNTPDDLRRWGARLGLGDASTGSDELQRALDLRAALHCVFAAIAHGDRPDTDALDRIAAHHADAVAAAQIARDDDAAWRLDWSPGDARRVRFAVVVDAVSLLGDADRLRRVRHCPGHDCGWLFLDLSGRRRWCSMDTCGSRAKMRRLYERQKREAARR